MTKTFVFIWGIIFFCTMNGSFRILKKVLSKPISARLYFFLLNYRCKLKHQLTRHLQIHDDPDDRKHKCEICGKGFIATQKLREHILTHTNIKPYKCELCNQAFSNFSGHRQHMMKKVRHFCNLSSHPWNLV